MKQKRLNDLLRYVLLAVAVLFFCLILFRSFDAVRTMGDRYNAIRNADLSEPFTDTIYYSDHFYAETGFGISVTPDMEDRQAFLDDWLETSLRAIDSRITATGCVYTLAFAVLLAYPLLQISGGDPKKHILSIVLSVFGFYLLYLLSVQIFHIVYRVPFYYPPRMLLLVFVSLLSIAGGFCALGLLLRSVRYKKTAALLALPLAAVLFLTGFVTEYGIFAPKYTDSFDYLNEFENYVQDTEKPGMVYYDAERNVTVWDGKDYPPQQIENPDHFNGVLRAGAILYEAVNPVSGNQLAMGESTGEYSVPLPAMALYSVKALLWILLPLFFKKRSQ